MRTCSFTGHRTVAKAHLSYVEDKLARGIEYLYERGFRNFLSGGAIGFDTMAALAVIEFRKTHPDVRLVMVLPCRNQSDGWSFMQRRTYARVLKLADEVIYNSQEDYYDGCMKERNAYLAETAEVIIAYVYKSRSGAAQTVRMAEKLGKHVFNLAPKQTEC
jgi:uncharacterized phage-like protein YoqJ